MDSIELAEVKSSYSPVPTHLFVALAPRNHEWQVRRFITSSRGRSYGPGSADLSKHRKLSSDGDIWDDGSITTMRRVGAVEYCRRPRQNHLGRVAAVSRPRSRVGPSVCGKTSFSRKT